MKIEYLKFMQKYLISYKGKPIGVGNNISEALAQALATLKTR
jgi:hypothetical protein